MGFSDVFRKLYPFLSIGASMAGGPFGAMAAGALSKALGMTTPPKDTEIENVIASVLGDPTKQAALVEAENSYKLQLQTLGVDSQEKFEELADADRANARARELGMAQAGKRDWTVPVLAGCIIGGFLFILWLVFEKGVVGASHDLALTMVGVLGVMAQSVVGYYFGSSKGSADKDKVLGDIAKS